MNKVLIDFLKDDVEPYPDSNYGDGFRCSVNLRDGTHLPCVILRNCGPTVDLAIKRFEQEKKGKGIFGLGRDGYKKIVKVFVTSGNRIDEDEVTSVEPSRYAMPLALLKQIEGETTMAWTGFVLEMRDGRMYAFGTPFNFEFFDLPAQYSFADVVAVHNHSYVSADGTMKKLKQGMGELPHDYDRTVVYRERPYFICYFGI